MPRVFTRTRKRKEVKRAMTCASCGKPVEVGQTYYTWSRKMGRSGATYFQHQECGYPKRSQLSSRKTVAIEDAIEDAQATIAAWTVELDHAEPTYMPLRMGYEDLSNALESVADVAREVGSEYQEGFDNMPEGLNQGDTAQAMEAVAQELDSWADDLESWSPSSDEPDMPDKDDYKQAGLEDGEDDYDLDAWRDACETALDDWASEIRSEAEDAMSDMPEYQG